MPLQLEVDVLKLVTAFLKAQSDVEALISSRVYPTGTPKAPTWPLVTLDVVGGAANYPNYLSHPRVQFSAWADDEPKAGLVARTTRAAILLVPGRYSSGIVTGVDEVTTPRWLPDPSVTPARPRYLFTAVLHTHPLPA